MIRSFLNYTATANGYDNTEHMFRSLFHPDNFVWAGPLSSVLAAVAYGVQSVFGIHVAVAGVLIVLFFLEMHTGIKASKKEGKGFESSKFPKGWFKLGVYAIMIGAMNVCAIYVPVKNFLGYDVNIYAFLHYAFYNYVLINLFISNIENFSRLGWEMGGFIPWISKRLNLEVLKPKKEGSDTE